MAAALTRIRDYAGLAARSLGRLGAIDNPMTRLVFLREIHATAVRSLGLQAGVALVLGSAFVVQATALMRDDLRLTTLIELVLVRNIAPLTAAAILIGRSATAISTQLALMRCNGEIDALRRMRIPVLDYLVVPRIAAVTLGTIGSCFFFQLIAVVGGFAMASIVLDVQFTEQLGRFASQASIDALALEIVKSACFGFTIGAVACGVGLGVAPRMEDVPLAPSRAFLGALVGVLFLDALFLVLQL